MAAGQEKEVGAPRLQPLSLLRERVALRSVSEAGAGCEVLSEVEARVPSLTPPPLTGEGGPQGRVGVNSSPWKGEGWHEVPGEGEAV